MAKIFPDRTAAGRELAKTLGDWANREDAVVLGLPRGGVPVAAEVARALRLPLDVLVVAKVGAPGQEELALGAVGPGGVRVDNRDHTELFRLPDETLDALVEKARLEVRRREESYRGTHDPLDVRGRAVLLIDDGLATGASMRAAVRTVRALGAAKVVVAVPVGAEEACAALRWEADDVRCLLVPHVFHAVGEWYDVFGQVSDEEVRRLLAQHARATA